MRESLLRLVGEGLAQRLPNRGFAVPAAGDERWQQLAQARAVFEPAMLRMSINRGDLDWEVRVRAAHHRLAGTPSHERVSDTHFSEAWSAAHHDFHRTLLEACGNDVLLDTLDRLWTSGELARRWSVTIDPSRDGAGEHRALEEFALARDPDRAAELLTHHLVGTATALAYTKPTEATLDPRYVMRTDIANTASAVTFSSSWRGSNGVLRRAERGRKAA